MSNILNVSEGSFLAIHSMAILSSVLPNGRSVKNLARKLNASEAHLAKVLQRLVKAGLVESTRGAGGGFKLNKPPRYISFLDIYEAIEGKLGTGICPFGRKRCMFPRCIFGISLNSISRDIYDVLKGIKLSKFAK